MIIITVNAAPRRRQAASAVLQVPQRPLERPDEIYRLIVHNRHSPPEDQPAAVGKSPPSRPRIKQSSNYPPVRPSDLCRFGESGSVASVTCERARTSPAMSSRRSSRFATCRLRGVVQMFLKAQNKWLYILSARSEHRPSTKQRGFLSSQGLALRYARSRLRRCCRYKVVSPSLSRRDPSTNEHFIRKFSEWPHGTQASGTMLSARIGIGPLLELERFERPATSHSFFISAFFSQSETLVQKTP